MESHEFETKKLLSYSVIIKFRSRSPEFTLQSLRNITYKFRKKRGKEKNDKDIRAKIWTWGSNIYTNGKETYSISYNRCVRSKFDQKLCPNIHDLSGGPLLFPPKLITSSFSTSFPCLNKKNKRFPLRWITKP